jgi:dienelactone hydrolase
MSASISDSCSKTTRRFCNGRVGRYLRDNLKMVDGSRVGVWGRGYGGAAAAAAAAGDPRNVTRCLAALAPLADLAHHNSYWTERYGGTLRAGQAVWRRAGNLPPRRLLLAHATADLTAPPHHALALARALIRAGAVYTHQVRPSARHRRSHACSLTSACQVRVCHVKYVLDGYAMKNTASETSASRGRTLEALFSIQNTRKTQSSFE